jgi:hypothetical protein
VKTNNNGLDCLIQVQIYILGLTLWINPMCKKLSLHTRPNPMGLRCQEKRNKNCQGQETTDSKRVERLEN